MSSYCILCRKVTDDVNPVKVTLSNGRKAIKSTCAICGTKKSKFVSSA